MICGLSSFHHDDDHQSSPRNSKKKHRAATTTTTNNNNNGGNNSKNPYSSRGLEKFTSVVSDLGARKEKILARTVSHGDADVSMVGFKYSASKDWVPIVVRRREDNCGQNNVTGLLSGLPEEDEKKKGGKGEKKLRKHVTWSNEGEVKKRGEH